MKKTIIIIIASILVIALAIGIYFLFINPMINDSTSKEDVESYNNTALLKVKTCGELQQLADSQELTLLNVEEDIYAINDINILDENISITYQYNNESIEIVRWSYDICKSNEFDLENKEDLDIAISKIESIVSIFDIIFEEHIGEYSIYAMDGYPLDVSEVDSYKKLFNGEAVFDLSIKDKDETIWNARTDYSNDGILSVHFYHMLRKDASSKLSFDIVIE